ncbi:flavodoxin [[Clostridium] innocuum]|uniref:flavodoxin n=1 Tax=Clostridium innocuum TaxID=1522 RepID=UPI000D6BBEB6|nr:flavodoxin [[Clostridium] innocuum]PWJ14374.1 flavodoxin [[Clostridium] innocuum]SSA45807.1 Flavodoxin [[Clostridium] innocuum]
MKKKTIASFVMIFVIGLLATSCSNNKNIIPIDKGEVKETEKEITSLGEKVLVVYFSPTGTTRKIAENAAEVLSADIYEIVPEIPYSEEDLNYNTNCRANREQEDPLSRPKMMDRTINIGQYDTIVIGYPIWHGQAPKILNTFLESYDFSDKIIIPFCTSHSSSVGTSAVNLQSLTSNTSIWLEGYRFNGTENKEEIRNWLSKVIQ